LEIDLHVAMGSPLDVNNLGMPDALLPERCRRARGHILPTPDTVQRRAPLSIRADHYQGFSICSADPLRGAPAAGRRAVRGVPILAQLGVEEIGALS
jgi:hypothetical protein